MKKRKMDEDRRERKRQERVAEKAAAKADTEAGGKSAAVRRLHGVALHPRVGAYRAWLLQDSSVSVPVVEEVVTEPNKILFVQGLPVQFPEMALQMLFQQ
jgi:hypothetical protein